MNNTTNYICLYIGGVITGAVATYGVMRKLGYHKDDQEPLTVNLSDLEGGDDATDVEGDDLPVARDKPSFDPKRPIDTNKVLYNDIRKPDPEELIKKYAEAEHPTEEDYDDDGESDFPTGELVDDEGKKIHYPKEPDGQPIFKPDLDEYDPLEGDEEAQFQNELGEAMMVEEEEGYGHIIVQLETGRKSDVIYLIPEAYLGEIYPVETLTYYEYDNVLCDAQDIPIDNVMPIVSTGLDHFGECLGEVDDAVYIRNCSIGVEYEITRVEGYYGAHLYGVSDEEFEGGAMANLPRKATRRKNTQREDD